MNAARHFIVVKAPVDRVYEQWSRLEDLPNSLRRCRRCVELTTRIFPTGGSQLVATERGIPHHIADSGRRIAWRSVSDGFMSGVVSFEPRSQEETEVTLKIRSIFDSSGCRTEWRSIWVISNGW